MLLLVALCKLGKSKILPFPLHVSSATKCFDLILSDVWGVAPIISHSQYKYFVTFIDDYNRFTSLHGFISYMQNLKSLMFLKDSWIMFKINFQHILSFSVQTRGGAWCVWEISNFFTRKRDHLPTDMYLHTLTKWNCKTEKSSSFGYGQMFAIRIISSTLDFGQKH